MDRTFGIHTSLCDVPVSYKHDIAYDVSQYPSRFADLCRLILGMKRVCAILSSTNSSACHMGASSGHHLFLIFFQCLSHRNQLQRMRSALDLEGHLLHAEVSFCFLVSVVGITTPANPGSFLMAACCLTNLVRSFRAGISLFSLIEYDTWAHLLIR